MHTFILKLFVLLIQITFSAQINFPIDEHLELPIDKAREGLQQLCSGPADFKYCCSCDDQCFKFKNCCIDKLWNKFSNTTHAIPLNEYYEKMISESEKFPDIKCENVFPLAYTYNERSDKYLMVSKCQQGATPEEVSACNNVNNTESYEYIIPVFASDNQLYKNTQCAKCNSVEQFQMVNIIAQCVQMFSIFVPKVPTFPGQKTTLPPPVKLIDRFDDCTFTLAEAHIYVPNIQRCKSKKYQSRDSCKPTSKHYKLCHSYYGIMGTYANYHCYLCENENDDIDIPPPSFVCPDDAEPHGNGQWSFTLSFSTQTKVHIKGGNIDLKETYCSNFQSYNPFTGECNEFKCAFGYEVNDTKCIKKITPILNKQKVVVSNPSYDKCLILHNKIVISTSRNTTTTDVRTTLRAIDNSTKNIIVDEIYRTVNYTFYQTNIKINNFTHFNNEISNTSSDIWQHIENIYITKHDVSVTAVHGLDFSRIIQDKLCANVEIFENFTLNLTTTCSLTIRNSSLTRQNYSQWIVYNKDSSNRKLSICNEYYLQTPCKLTTINTNYSISEENQTLTIGNQTFKVSEYTPLNEGVGICNTVNPPSPSPSPVRYSWMDIKDDWEFYISIIGTSLSIVCYIIIVVTYLHFKELRTIPGLTVVGLCVTLLFTDILFLVGSQVTKNFLACKLLAMCLHWGLLSTQAWILVISFDLLSRFGSVGLAAVKNSSKRFTQYCLFVLLLPSLLVGTAIILNEYEVFDIGYGEQDVCFIYYLYPRVYFYIIPVATSLLLTIISFARSITVISLTERKTRKVLLNSGRQNTNLISIGFKMVLVLGLIEIIGFIQIRKDNATEKDEIFNAVFAILYSMCRSLRGVLLAVIYICNKQKLELYKSLVGRSKEQMKSRAQTMDMDISSSRL